IDVGRGLLGVLEQFAREDEAGGVRTYVWPAGRAGKKVPKGKNKAGGKGDKKLTLRTVGAGGNLATVYLPALLGKKTVCDGFTPGQRRLLQAIVRETTRRTRGDPDNPPKAVPVATSDGVESGSVAGPDGGDGAVQAPLAPGDAAVLTGAR